MQHLRKLIIPALTLLLFACNNQKKNAFSLKGKLKNASGETLVLEQMTRGKSTIIDSAKVDEEGNFEFQHARIPQMDFYMLRITPSNFAMLVMDSTQQITFSGDAKQLGKNYQAEGSSDTKHFISLNQILEKTKTSFDSLKQEYQATMASIKMDSLKMDSLNKLAQESYIKIINRFTPVLKRKIEEFPGTIANYIAFNFVNIEENLSLYEKVGDSLTARCPSCSYTKQLKENISSYKQQLGIQQEQDKTFSKGQPMPEIKLNNPDGQPLTLSSLKGKVVLVDFWASWCGPCRAENPNVVKMYKKYHPKGFDIFSVSLDEEKDKWVKAIEKDGLVWNHVSDLMGWNSPLCKTFGITGIPFTILVDRQGNVAAKGLRGEALDTKVSELLGK